MKTIFTIGYEGTDIDRFVETLLASGVSTLADVRAVPLSRKRGFSKNVLREALEREQIGYFHFADLGDPKEGRDAARAGEYGRFRSVFARHLRTAKAQIALSELCQLADSVVTCLMCFERDSLTCHRSMIASVFAGRGMQVVNLYCDSQDRFTHDRKLLPSHDSDQGRAAAQQEVR